MRANGFITFFAESLALCHIPDGIYQLYDIILDLEIVTRPCSYVKITIQGNFIANWHIISDHLEISQIYYFFWLQIWVHFFRSFVTFGLFRAYNKYLQHSNEFRCEFGCNWSVFVLFPQKNGDFDMESLDNDKSGQKISQSKDRNSRQSKDRSCRQSKDRKSHISANRFSVRSSETVTSIEPDNMSQISEKVKSLLDHNWNLNWKCK